MREFHNEATAARGKRLREGLWAVAFIAVLAGLLAPLLVWSQASGREISIPLQALMILVATWLCQWLRNKPLSETIGRVDARWLRQLFVGVLVGAALMIAPAAMLALLGSIAWEAQPASAPLILSAIGAMGAVAIAEELLFRGFLFQRLIGAIGVWPAQLAIAGLFALTHLGNPGMHGATKAFASANIFLASILFGLAYLRTASLAIPIGIHFAANAVQGVVLGMAVSGSNEASILVPSFMTPLTWLTGGAFGLEGSVPGLATLVVLLALFALATSNKGSWRNLSFHGGNHE